MNSRKKVVVTFADIRGSSRWMRRMADDELCRHNFMRAYDTEALYFKERSGCTFYKRIGDGRMFVHELPERASDLPVRILLESMALVSRVERLIARLPSPRPGGFRVRHMAGTVVNEVYEDGENDWIGYVPNTCSRLLGVRPDVPLVVQETFKELVSTQPLKKRGIRFEHLKPDRRCPDGVDQEDLDALYTVIKALKEK
jgi:class 3 adenylate cyclase